MKKIGLLKLKKKFFYRFGVLFVNQNKNSVSIKIVRSYLSLLGIAYLIFSLFISLILSVFSLSFGFIVFLLLVFFGKRVVSKKNASKIDKNSSYNWLIKKEDVDDIDIRGSLFGKNYIFVKTSNFSFKIRGIKGNEDAIKYLIKMLASEEDLRKIKNKVNS